MNIIKYAETNMERFDACRFNAVDSLILSQLAYMYFDGMVPPVASPPVRIAELLKAECFEHMLRNVRAPKNNYKLLLALGMSPRFRDIQLCCYTNSLDLTQQKQFAAITCLLDDETAYVAYRGTDNTFVGWKEDFNMAFTAPVPAQLEGARYLNTVAGCLPHKLLVGGHSKGGNIAVYSAMECQPHVQSRVVNVYSHDGPGFRDEIFVSEKYTGIKTRINKTLPQSSLVGMLLHYQEDYFVVKSKQFWVMQHDPFSWVVESGDFRYAKRITGGAEHINSAISQWLAELDDDKRELFISTLYNVIEEIGIVNFSDLTAEWLKNVATALDAAKGVDPETKTFIKGTLMSLMTLSVKNLRFRNSGKPNNSHGERIHRSRTY